MIDTRKWRSIGPTLVVVLLSCFLAACERKADKISRYTEEIAKNPNNFKAYHDRAKVKMNLALYSSALDDFQRAAELSPDSPDKWEIYYDMSESYYYLNRRQLALEALKKALQALEGRKEGVTIADDMAILKSIKKRQEWITR